jgi:hypothetical protein
MIAPLFGDFASSPGCGEKGHLPVQVCCCHTEGDIRRIHARWLAPWAAIPAVAGSGMAVANMLSLPRGNMTGTMLLIETNLSIRAKGRNLSESALPQGFLPTAEMKGLRGVCLGQQYSGGRRFVCTGIECTAISGDRDRF